MKLRQLVEQYVAFKQSLGADFRTSAYALKAFSKALGDELDVQDVQPQQVNAFLVGTGPITSHWHRKHSALVGFYDYAISHRYVATSPLPTVLPKKPERCAPYIYTHDELRRLFSSTAACQRQRTLLEPDTFRALLLLLYGAGLRISEALGLTLADADLPAALITVRDTKFYKTRLVALGPELNREMSQYQRSREQAGHSRRNDAPFFIAHNGKALGIHVIQGAFQRLRVHAGVCRTDGGHYQPRLHDLRHTFAVDRLTSWYREGKNVQKLLPQLSTYMGHISISSTQLYLTLTPELLREASMRFAQYALKEGGHD